MTEPSSQVASRLTAFGESVFTPITRLAGEFGAVNLGQGFPDFEGPAFIRNAAIDALRAGHNQYARPFGISELVEAIADCFEASAGFAVDPLAEITVTSGCTEAIPATLLGLIEPGDEVIVFEPFYDSYPACISMAGATLRPVTLRAPDFTFDEAELRAAFNRRTRAIIINSPHNPTGRVFHRDELEFIAGLCQEHDCLAIADEVYERLVFDVPHIPIASLEGMAERTVTMSSVGKTFSFTGWKVGWAVAPPALTAGIRAAHQFLTYATATPLQHAAAAALRAPQSYFDEFVSSYRSKRDRLVNGLSRIGFDVRPPEGTYFVLADHTSFGFDDDWAFCRHLIEHVGVAAIPPSSFYANPEHGRSLVRFAFCKQDAVLDDAIQRMAGCTTLARRAESRE